MWAGTSLASIQFFCTLRLQIKPDRAIAAPRSPALAARLSVRVCESVSQSQMPSANLAQNMLLLALYLFLAY